MSSVKLKSIFSYPLLFVFIFYLSACGNHSASETVYEPTYSLDSSAKKYLIVGVANRSYYELIDFMVRCLNKRLKNVQLKLVAALTYEDYENKLKAGAYDFTLVNGLTALDVSKIGYRVIAKYGDDSTYYSIILSRKESSIKSFNDLKGKKIALAGKGSILGDMAPLVFLHQNGVNVNTDIMRAYFPSFESAILNVYFGKYDAGVAWSTMWSYYSKTHPSIASKMVVKWKTHPLVNLAFVIKNSVDSQVVESITKELFSLHQYDEGRNALRQMNVSKIEKVEANTYKPILELKGNYDKLSNR